MNQKPWILALIIASVSLTMAGGWKSTPIVEDDKTLAASEIREVLSDLKLKAEEDKDDEDKTYWAIQAGDDTLLLYQYGGEGDVASSLGISAMLESDADLEALNAWNADERYTKAYQPEEKVVVFESDLDMSVSPSKAVVKKFLQQFLEALPKFEESIK